MLEYDKPVYSIKLPEPTYDLPWFRPLPKEKGLTKWEWFWIEKGLPPRKKRSRMVFDPITNDWVPRWGPGSIKKIQEASEFIIEEKKTDIPIE